MLIQKSSAVVFVEDSSETPWVVLERLNILDFNEEDIAGFSGFDLERSREIVDLSQVDVLDIVGAVVVANLAACPIEAFDLDDFAVLDGAAEGNWVGVSGLE